MATPSSISGLLAWFDASAGTSLAASATALFPQLAAPADGASIGSWADNSGNNTTIFSQATAANQPTYKASGLGLPGHPCLEFYFPNSQPNANGPQLSERVATLYNSLGNANTVLILAWRNTQAGPGFEVYLTNTPAVGSGASSGAEFLFNWNSQGCFTRYNSGMHASLLATGSVNGVAYTFDGTSNEALYVNSAAAPSATATGARPAMTNAAFEIGDLTQTLNGEVYEVVIFNRALASSEIAQVYAYWNGKYGTSFNASAGSLQPSTIVASNVTKTGATLCASATLGGTSPYTYQWYRSTANGTAASIAIAWNAVSGATATTLADTGLSVQTPYYYVFSITDSTSTQVLSSVLTVQTHGATTVAIQTIGDSIMYGAQVTHGVNDPITMMAAALQTAYPAYDFQVVNNGVSGQRFRTYSPLSYNDLPGSDIVVNLIQQCQQTGAKFVVMMEGTNDWDFGPDGTQGTDYASLTPANYLADIEAVASALATAGITLIVNQLVYRTTTGADNATTGLPARNAEIAALPFSSTLKQGDTTMYAYFKSNAGQLVDGLHPGIQGSATLGQAWAAALGPLVTAASAASSGAGETLEQIIDALDTFR